MFGLQIYELQYKYQQIIICLSTLYEYNQLYN